MPQTWGEWAALGAEDPTRAFPAVLRAPQRILTAAAQEVGGLDGVGKLDWIAGP